MYYLPFAKSSKSLDRSSTYLDWYILAI